jgi:hypothetical protein
MMEEEGRPGVRWGQSGESGKLPVLRLPGRLIRIRPSALEAFLERECR